MADDVERPHPSTGRVILGVALGLVALIGLLGWAHGRSLEPQRVVGDVAGGGPRPPRSSDQQILGQVGLGPTDVRPGYEVSLLDQGDQLSQPTLDFCGLPFASEARREARHQVAASDSSGDTALSSEAVLYQDQSSAAEAMGQVRGMRSRCPSKAVEGQTAAEPPLVWRVRSTSTAGWPGPGEIDRVAMAVSVTDSEGDSVHQVVVYLRRGRLLLGLYFEDPPAPVVIGAPDIGATVGLFQRRLADLPAADVS